MAMKTSRDTMEEGDFTAFRAPFAGSPLKRILDLGFSQKCFLAGNVHRCVRVHSKKLQALCRTSNENRARDTNFGQPGAG